jgi:CRP-like cAMP-binding protein
MEETDSTRPDHRLLAELECLGSGRTFNAEIFGLVDQTPFFSEFTRDDIDVLSEYMQIYRAQRGQALIHEGDVGDYMLLIIKGEVDILKKNLLGVPQIVTSVMPGTMLGEMSMIDGEPRFATCRATHETLFGVLTRDNMVKIILENPSLGAKILIRLVTLLSQRLRQTSLQLMQYMK